MPSYNLTQPEQDILISWLFEPFGYLDTAVNAVGQAARQAYALTPATFDATLWCRTNTPSAQMDPQDWQGCAMVWWIWKNRQVNITPPTRPPETSVWLALLDQWDASLSPAAIQRGTDAGTTITLYREDGTSTLTQPLGQNRQAQKSLIGKAISVLR